MPTATELHPLFAARIQGVDVGASTDAAWIRDALDRWSVLVFPNQTITDASQVALSEIFGPLETTRAGANGAGGKLIVLTNIGPDNQIAPPTDKQVLNNKANQFWHHDSSFKAIPARASILSAREKALYLGQHAKSIRGLNEEDSRALIDDLMTFATKPAFVYSHRWQQGDVVVWDNRAVMHRATPFANTRERRHMVRTTASCPPSVH